MAGFRKIYTSQTDYLKDLATSTGLFSESEYARQVSNTQGDSYLAYLSTLKDNISSNFNWAEYNKLADEDKFGYIVHKHSKDISSEDYKQNEAYYNQKLQEIKNDEIYASLNGFQKTMATLGGWFADMGLAAYGTLEGLIDVGALLVGGGAAIGGIWSDDAKAFSKDVKGFMSQDTTGVTAAKNALANWRDAYTFENQVEWLKVANEVSSAIGQMAPMIIGAVLAPVSGGASLAGTAVYYTAMAGQTAEQAIRTNPDINYAKLYGYTAGTTALEMATEWASGKIFGEGLIGVAGINKNAMTGSILKNIGHNMFTEGMEEAVSELFGSLLEWSLVTDFDENSLPTIENILYAAMIGSLTGGFMAGGRVALTTRMGVDSEGNIVRLKDVAKDNRKNVKKLGLGKSWAVQSLLQQSSEALSATDNMTKLQAKYGHLNLQQIQEQHADEYQKAYDSDVKVKEQQAKTFLALSKLMNTIGATKFTQSVELLNNAVEDAKRMADNYINHTATANKKASEVFAANFPDKSFTPTAMPSKQNQTLAETIRQIFPGVKVVFGKFGSKDGSPVRAMDGAETYIFVDETMVDKKGYKTVLRQAIRYQLADQLMEEMNILDSAEADAIVELFTDSKLSYSALDAKQKLTIAQMLCFDPVNTRKLFGRNMKTHKKIFKYITDNAAYVKKFGRQTEANKMRYHDLLGMRNMYLQNIADTIGNAEDIAVVENEYGLTPEETKTKLVDKTRTTVVNDVVKLTDLKQSKQAIQQREAFNELNEARVDTTTPFDFDRMWDKDYYNSEFVASITQTEPDFKKALQDYVLRTHNVTFAEKGSFVKAYSETLTANDVELMAKALLTKEYLDSNPSFEDKKTKVIDALYIINSTGVDKKSLQNVDTIIEENNQIKGTGKLKYFKGVLEYGRDLLEEQDWIARKSSEKELSRVAREPNKSDYERRRELKEKLRESPNHEVVENDEYLINIQKSTSYTLSQKNIVKSVKKFFGVNCAFYGGEIYNTQTNEFEFSYGFTDGDTIFLKYRDSYDFAQLEHIIQHENFHILAKQNPDKFNDFMNTIKDNLTNQDLEDLKNELSKSLSTLNEQELLEEIGAMFVSGELIGRFLDFVQVKRAVAEFYENTTTKLVPDISYSYWSGGKGVIYAEQRNQELGAFHAVDSFAYLLNSIEKNSLTGASVAIGEKPATGYGDYVFVIKPRRIDPSANEFTTVWNGDAYTVTHPEITYGLKDKDFEKVTNKLKKFLDTFDLPELRKQYLIENFMNTWKDYMSPTAFSSQQFEWTPDNILARLLYAANNKSIDVKSILEESLYYDNHVGGSVSVSALESFLERHKNITKDANDVETMLLKMVDDGDIDSDELYIIPHNIFYGKDQHKITRLSRAIQEYYEGRHIHIVPELLFEKLPVFGGDVINYFDDLFGKIPVTERMVSDNNTSIEATTDALFEYFWNRKGVDKTFLTDDETKIRLAGLDELQTLEDIKIQAAAKLSDFSTHRATHYSLINTITVVLEILQDQLNISHTKAVKLLQDIVKSSGIYSDIVDTLNKHTNHPINATVLNSLIDVITKVRQVRNIYFEAKIYNTLDINQDVGALMIPNDLDNNAWLRLKNALAKHAPNVELIEYDRMSDEDPVIQAKELFKRNKTLLFDKPIKRTTESSTKQPSVANQILKRFEDGSKALSEVQYSESNSKEYLQVSYDMIDEMADTFALVNNDNYDEVRKALKNSKKSYAQQALRIFDLYTIEMVGKFNPDIAQKIENNYQKTASGAGQTMALQAQRVAERKPISDTISTLKNDGFNVTVTDEIVQLYDSKLKDKEAYIKELEQQIKNLEKQLQTAKNDIDKAALNKQLKEVSDKKGVIQSGSNSDILDHILTHIDSPEQMTKLQEDMLGKLLNTAIKAQEEGKKVGYYKYDENGQPKPFPKATEKLTKTLKKLKSFRMWSMLSSPVTWVRNWLGNQGMKGLDAMTNFVEGFMTSRSDFDKSQMKFTESRAGNDLYNYIAEQNETYIMSLVRGEDVKYETTAEKAADIKRRERQIEYESANAFRKACLKAQDMADWGLSTGPLGDEPVVFRSICKNMGNLVANNINFLMQGIQAEANLLSKRTTLTEKEQARLDILNKAITTKGAKDVFNALSKEETSRLFDVCKERSFQQYFKNPNALSKWFSKFGAKHPVYAELVSWVMPFPKVAANVLSMAYRYSPLSFFKGLSEMSKYKQMQAKDYTGPSTGFEKALMIRTFSEATVGTFMLIAGAIFSAMGLIDIDDDDYMGPCIKIGDFKVSLSDLAPSMTTFSTASAVVWAWKNDRVGVTDALNVLYDNTLLGNVENLLTYGSFTDIAKNVSISYISQYIPAILKLINKGITGGVKKDKSGTYLQRLVKTLGSYVPGVSQLVPNKIDPYTGKKVYQAGSENWFLNLLASLSPLGISWDGRSELEKQAELLEVETTGLSGKFTINETEYIVKDKEKYSKYRAEHINEYFNNIVSGKQKVTVEDENGKRVTTTYDKLTNEQKKNVINRLYTEATSMTKIKWWTDQGNKYVVTNRDLYNEYRKMFSNIVYKKNWSKSKFVES